MVMRVTMAIWIAIIMFNELEFGRSLGPPKIPIPS